MCPNIFQQHLLVDFLAKFLTCQFQIPRIISIQRELYPVRTSIMNEKIVLWKGVNIWRVHSMYYVCKLHPTWWSRYNVWVVSEILPWDQKKELQTKTYQTWYFSKPILFSKGNPGRQDSCDENNNCHDTCHSGLGTYSCGSTQHHADDKDCSCNHSITKPTDYCPSCNHCHWWDPCWSGLTGRKDYSPSDDYFATNSASKCGH